MNVKMILAFNKYGKKTFIIVKMVKHSVSDIAGNFVKTVNKRLLLYCQ